MYQWFVVVGSLFAFVYGFGTGSNDVANAFASSVGSKSLTMNQALLIAFLFEFTGAIVLGRVSTSTIAGGIADITQFKQDPEMYAYGMMISLGVAGFLQIFGSFLELNISSTHSIIGCIMGFSLVYKGGNGVLWAVPDTTGTTFPPYKGVVPIFFSWVFSPVLTAIAAAIIFTLCRTFVLRRMNASKKALWVLPIAVFGTSWINVYFVLTKGAKKLISQNSEWSDRKACLIALYAALGLTGVCTSTVVPYIIFKSKKKFETTCVVDEIEQGASPVVANKEGLELQDVELQVSEIDDVSEEPVIETRKDKLMKALKKNFKPVMEENVEEDELVAAMHKSAEVFEPKAEYVFSFLQIFSAISVVFAHGAGEVGYMAGPLAAIWDYTQTGVLNKKVSPPIWVILISAFGLVFGLAIYGQKLTMAMGVKLTKLSPTRGFAAELATATVIMVAAQYGLPTSSSQCIIGGLVGVGLMEGMKGINWKFFAAQAASWVVNLFLSLGIVAAIFAQGVYSPSLYQASQLNYYESSLNAVSKDMLGICNNTGNVSMVYGKEMLSMATKLKTMGKVANPHADGVVSLLNGTLAYYKNHTC